MIWLVPIAYVLIYGTRSFQFWNIKTISCSRNGFGFQSHLNLGAEDPLLTSVSKYNAHFYCDLHPCFGLQISQRIPYENIWMYMVLTCSHLKGKKSSWRENEGVVCLFLDCTSSKPTDLGTPMIYQVIIKHTKQQCHQTQVYNLMYTSWVGKKTAQISNY